MIYPAFEAREVTGEVLLKDRTLMELWKWASDEGQVQAVQLGGDNYAVVKDEDLAAKLQAFAPGLKRYAYDETSQELR
jgi:hypothetical protein